MGAEKEKERRALGHVVAAGVSAFEGAEGGSAAGASGSGAM